jgi:hypothetical protein
MADTQDHWQADGMSFVDRDRVWASTAMLGGWTEGPARTHGLLVTRCRPSWEQHPGLVVTVTRLGKTGHVFAPAVSGVPSGVSGVDLEVEITQQLGLGGVEHVREFEVDSVRELVVST